MFDQEKRKGEGFSQQCLFPATGKKKKKKRPWEGGRALRTRSGEKEGGEKKGNSHRRVVSFHKREEKK